MTILTHLGDVKEIDLPGRWARQTVGIKYLGKRRILQELIRADIQTIFYYAERPLNLDPAGLAHMWHTFSPTSVRRDANKELLPSALKRFELLLDERLDKNEFILLSATLRVFSGRLALQIAGSHANHGDELRCLMIPQRRGDSWVLQELGFFFPRDWHLRRVIPQFRGYTALVRDSWKSIQWAADFPPLYVPSKVRVS